MNTIKASLLLAVLGCLGTASDSQAMGVNIHGNNNMVIIDAASDKYRAEEHGTQGNIYDEIYSLIQNVKHCQAALKNLQQNNAELSPFGVESIVEQDALVRAKNDLYEAKDKLKAAKAQLETSMKSNRYLQNTFGQTGIVVAQQQAKPVEGKKLKQSKKDQDLILIVQQTKQLSAQGKQSSKIELIKEDSACSCCIQ